MIFLNSKALKVKTEIEEQIKRKEAEIPEREELEKTAQYYFNLVEDFKTVVQNHTVTSPFFEPFEKIVHPKVLFYNISLDINKKTISFSGAGENLTAVGQQFLVLKNNNAVKNISLTNLSLIEAEREGEKKRVEFSFSGELEPTLLNFNLE
jgi:hypothetical protein